MGLIGLAVVNRVGVDGRRHASLRDRAGRLTPVPLPAGWEFAILYAIDNAGQVYGLNIADMACFIARPGPVDWACRGRGCRWDSGWRTQPCSWRAGRLR